MTNDRTYNGWKNYETWVVKLWIDNEQGDSEYWSERTRELSEVCVPAHGMTAIERATIALADELKERHQEISPELTGVFVDLLNAAMSKVDWYEIAQNMIEAEVAA